MGGACLVPVTQPGASKAASPDGCGRRHDLEAQRTHTAILVRVSLRPQHSVCQLGLATAHSDASADALLWPKWQAGCSPCPADVSGVGSNVASSGRWKSSSLDQRINGV